MINKKGEEINKLSEGSSIVIYCFVFVDYYRYYYFVGVLKVIL